MDKYDEALEEMRRAIVAEAIVDRDYDGHTLVNPADCARAAAEAIGLREMMERLAELEEWRDEAEQDRMERDLLD